MTDTKNEGMADMTNEEGDTAKYAAVWLSQWRDSGPVVGRLSQSQDFPGLLRLEVTEQHDYANTGAVLHINQSAIDVIKEKRAEMPARQAPPAPPPRRPDLPPPPHKVDGAALEEWHGVLSTLSQPTKSLLGMGVAVVEWTAAKVRVVYEPTGLVAAMLQEREQTLRAPLSKAVAAHFSAKTALELVADPDGKGPWMARRPRAEET